MKIKTSELTGSALDWAVAKCEGLLCFGYRTDGVRFAVENSDGNIEDFMPSSNWAQGGLIIEREELSRLRCYGNKAWECLNGDIVCEGATPLIAAMRCYVTSQLGDEIEVPDELRGESK